MSSRADADGAPRPPPPRRSRAWILLVGLVAGALAWLPARRFVRATEMLVDLSSPPGPRAQGTTVDLTVEHSGGAARARLYVPRTTPHRCLVVGHGVHYKSIEEPRLVRFANELAKAGAVVLTPELAELADYRVTRSGAEVLGASVLQLSERCPAGDKVGLLGFSFAGGLALLAALDPRISSHLAYVASVGGYHDLSRVLSFLLTDQVKTPNGPVSRKAHEYGLVVLLYGHIDDVVPQEDASFMREAVLSWLEEDRARAWAFASQRTTERAEEIFMAIATGHRDALRSLLAVVEANEHDSPDALSPAGRLAEIPVPVYLLHGTGDSVIPPEETTWAARELGDHTHRALVTPLIEHVELDAHFRISDALELVEFIAALI